MKLSTNITAEYKENIKLGLNMFGSLSRDLFHYFSHFLKCYMFHFPSSPFALLCILYPNKFNLFKFYLCRFLQTVLLKMLLNQKTQVLKKVCCGNKGINSFPAGKRDTLSLQKTYFNASRKRPVK